MADEDLAALSAATGIDLDEASPPVLVPETPPEAEGGEPTAPIEGDAKAGPTAKTPAPTRESRSQHMVPLETMIAERREFQKQMDEIRAAISQKAKEEAPKLAELPDPFMDPKGFAEAIANQRSQAAIQQAMESTVNPVQQQLRQAVDYLHRTAAESKFSAEELQQAEAELTKLQQETGQLTPPELVPYLITPQRPNPYVNAVMWHRERQLRQEAGGDIATYRQRLLDQALQDPDFLGRATEAARLYAAGQPAGQVAPPQGITASPRPAVKPLPSLNRAGSGANATPQQRVPTDEDFMTEALKGRR